MTQRSRSFLFTNPFSNGQRPDENDFKDVWDSFINFQDDPIAIDGDNFVISNGLKIGNSTAEDEGTIRFVGGEFEFRQSGSWVKLGSGSGGGAFEEVNGGPDVAFNAGKVGIGTGITATQYLFQVNTGLNTGTENQIRLGSAVIHDRATGTPPDHAHFSHFNRASNTEFALRQEGDGAVTINAPLTQRIEFKHNNTDTRIRIEDTSGNVIVGGSVSNTVQNNNSNAVLFTRGEIVMSKSTSNTKNVWEILEDFETRISNLEP